MAATSASSSPTARSPAPVNEALKFDDAANIPANALGEQKAFQDFLAARHPNSGTAYNVPDTTVANDPRIRILPTATDNVIPAGQDTDGNGFTDVQEGQLAALTANPFYVGQTLSTQSGTQLDLRAILFPGLTTLPVGTTLTLTGLPTGLSMVNGVITGTILAESGGIPGVLTLRQGTRTSTFSFDLKVLPFQLNGVYEVLIVDASSLPVGKAKLTVTGPKAYSATMELLNQSGRATSKAGLLTNLTSPLAVKFPAVGTTSPETTLNFTITPNSDLVSGTVTVVPTTGAPAVLPVPASFHGFRLVNPGLGGIAQRVTVALQAPTGDPATVPGGTGYATGTATGTGTLPLRVVLGDTQSFSTTLNLSTGNQAVVFVQPYTADRKISFFGGIVTVGNIGLQARGSPPNGSPKA